MKACLPITHPFTTRVRRGGARTFKAMTGACSQPCLSLGRTPNCTPLGRSFGMEVVVTGPKRKRRPPILAAMTFAGTVLFAGGLAVTVEACAQSSPPGSFQVAKVGSCQSWFRTCAARCKERAPLDKACVSERCTPKLSDCRLSGCWEQGELYGGAKQCGLAK